ncbi:MAG: hypothetical protein A2286_04075 [Gammaproteobacteria bacterium RIFOXYA12_FULL_61_12]|nr:MAG: hypothetical protein A2286_04075 [Gammaproteobacteria bacterium RIFOXYA12_FULL_61_12]
MSQKKGPRGPLTRGIAALESAGLTLADALDPARERELLARPDVGRKTLLLLREEAGRQGVANPLHQRLLSALWDEWLKGAANVPGVYHLAPETQDAIVRCVLEGEGA